ARRPAGTPPGPDRAPRTPPPARTRTPTMRRDAGAARLRTAVVACASGSVRAALPSFSSSERTLEAADLFPALRGSVGQAPPPRRRRAGALSAGRGPPAAQPPPPSPPILPPAAMTR